MTRSAPLHDGSEFCILGVLFYVSMNFSRFDSTYESVKDSTENSFPKDGFTATAPTSDIPLLKASSEFSDFLNSYGGRSYGSGLYRIHTFNSALYWTSAIEGFHPEFMGKILCFGYDWEGNMFVQRLDENQSVVMIFEIATGDYFELEQTIRGFHEEDLIDYVEETLHKEKFLEVMAELKIDKLTFNQCIGHKVSLLLGGEDVIANMEVTDFDVHWSLQQQIMNEINKRA